MQLYTYTRLDSQNEIRILELLPGHFEDDIRGRLHHITLSPETRDRPSVVAALDSLQSTLPAGWAVRETLRDRFLFKYDRTYGPKEPVLTSWTHPLTGIAPEPIARRHPYHTEPSYEALSHAWGAAGGACNILLEERRGQTRPILLEEDGQPRYLHLRNNLATGLRYLRNRQESRMLWVDSVCIDQQNLLERAQQVREMGKIYGLAKRVVIWLGPETDDSTLAFATLNYLGQQVEMVRGGGGRLGAPQSDHPEWSRRAVPLPYDQRTWTAIASIVNRPWFKRLWALQEAKLGRDLSVVQCGHDEIRLHTLGQGLHCAASKGNTGAFNEEVEATLYRSAYTCLRGIILPFYDTLLGLSSKECSDLRDNVYGVLGLAPKSVANLIVPDYAKSVAYAYHDACSALLKANGRLEFLCACTWDTRETPECPSWVQDFSVPNRHIDGWYMSAFRASGVSVAAARLLDDASTLEAMGVRCGFVRDMSSKASREACDVRATIADWKAMCSPGATYVDGRLIEDAFGTTIVGGYLRERFPWDASLPTLSQVKAFINDSVSHETQIDLRGIPGRSFVVLDSGYICTVGAVAKPGDIVCVVLGCPLPLLLRPTTAGHYRVMGEAYVQGLMDAECLLGPLKPNWNVHFGTEADWNGSFRFSSPSGDVTIEDPRLGVLPPEWTQIRAERTTDDPIHFAHFENNVTGQCINGDPRLLPEALQARGVKLETFRLV